MVDNDTDTQLYLTNKLIVIRLIFVYYYPFNKVDDDSDEDADMRSDEEREKKLASLQEQLKMVQDQINVRL